MIDYVFSGSSQVKKLFLLIHLLWLLTIAASVGVNHYYSRREVQQMALAEAQAVFQRDMAFRHWFAENGGVYVKVSPRTPPNSFLAQIPERDITTPGGTQLTMVNPAYLMRLVNESIANNNAPLTHMTSALPLRPGNRPDPWESVALERAAAGEQETYEFVTIAGRPTLRYLHAAMVEEPCLKCHAAQGYKVGDLRGGMAVTLPVGTIMAAHDKSIRNLYLWHLLIYLLGLFVLLLGQRFIARQVRDRTLAMTALANSEANFRTVADFAFAWEYWLAPDGSMEYVSPSVAKITGYPPQRFLSDPAFLRSIMVDDPEEILHRQLHDDLQHRDDELDFQIRTASGEVRWLHHISRPVYDRSGAFLGRRASNYDITKEKLAEQQKDELLDELRAALEKVQLLSGFLPICASCKKIRDDSGYWNQIESYVAKHSEAVFSHSICPACAKKLYPEDYTKMYPAEKPSDGDGEKA